MLLSGYLKQLSSIVVLQKELLQNGPLIESKMKGDVGIWIPALAVKFWFPHSDAENWHVVCMRINERILDCDYLLRMHDVLHSLNLPISQFITTEWDSVKGRRVFHEVGPPKAKKGRPRKNHFGYLPVAPVSRRVIKKPISN